MGPAHKLSRWPVDHAGPESHHDLCGIDGGRVNSPSRVVGHVVVRTRNEGRTRGVKREERFAEARNAPQHARAPERIPLHVHGEGRVFGVEAGGAPRDPRDADELVAHVEGARLLGQEHEGAVTPAADITQRIDSAGRLAVHTHLQELREISPCRKL